MSKIEGHLELWTDVDHRYEVAFLELKQKKDESSARARLRLRQEKLLHETVVGELQDGFGLSLEKLRQANRIRMDSVRDMYQQKLDDLNEQLAARVEVDVSECFAAMRHRQSWLVAECRIEQLEAYIARRLWEDECPMISEGQPPYIFSSPSQPYVTKPGGKGEEEVGEEGIDNLETELSYGIPTSSPCAGRGGLKRKHASLLIR